MKAEVDELKARLAVIPPGFERDEFDAKASRPFISYMTLYLVNVTGFICPPPQQLRFSKWEKAPCPSTRILCPVRVAPILAAAPGRN